MGFVFGAGGGAGEGAPPAGPTPAFFGSNDNSSGSNPNNTATTAPSFSLGGSAPATAATGGTPAGTTTGVSFGGAAPPANNDPAPSGVSQPLAASGAPSGPSAGGFSFGGSSSGGAGASSSSAPPAPTGGGFSFGGAGAGGGSASTSTPAPASGNTAPAPTGFSFGGGGGSASNNNNNAGNTGASNPSSGQAATTTSPYMTVPEFTTVFPGLQIAKEIRRENRFESSSIATLFQVKTLWNQHSSNPSTRQRLQQQRIVLLPSSSDPNRKEEATLSDDMLRELFTLANDLALSEEQALALLAKSKTQSKFTPEALYWNERKQHLEILLYMFQTRLAVYENQASGEKSLISVTDELLQKGLVGELMQLISEFSQRLDRLIDQRRRHIAEAPDEASRVRQSNVFSMHIDFAIKQRQMAAEILFFISYHFHWNNDEIVRLLQLIRSLSNGDDNNLEVSPGLRAVNPYDVPSAYTHSTNFQQQTQHAMWMEGFVLTSSRQLEEKNPFDWKNELVELNWNKGHPQLLVCVATLLVTALSALDQRQSLQNRVTGQCEAPTEEFIQSMLDAIHPELYAEDWKISHLLGLLLASYAITLQATNNPAINSPLSPRSGSSPFHMRPGTSFNNDIRRSFRHALEAPSVFKTFSFSRLALIPALQIPTAPSLFSGCNTSEFLLAVLTDVTAQFFGLLLRYNPPISRAKWLQDAEEDLRLRRSDRDNYRQFQNLYRTKGKLEAIPNVVDLLQRPDCMDDILALCYDLCQLDGNFAATFWKQQNVPDVLAELEKIQREDESLLPGFIDLITALSIDSPDLVHRTLSTEQHSINSTPPSTGSGDSIRINLRWVTVFEILRHYARELVNKESGSAENSTKRADSSTSDNSTMYYYFSSDDGIRDSKFSTRSSSSSSRSRELGEANTLILSSHLMLVEAVASRSGDARNYLRQLTLPIVSTESAVGQDSLWMILFSLTSAPLSPELRGLVFRALASIVDGSSEEEIKQAWTCVEDCGILPIDKLLVYSTPIPEGLAPRISFPPSSTARINEKHCKSWILADPSYALIYEMEFVEASMGVYPSTTGFLKLLAELIRGGGSPADLGVAWRSQSGCSPYISYVTDLVLPRACGTFRGLPALPFRCSGDKDRILAMGFDVLATCLKRYLIPDFSGGQDPTLEKSRGEIRKDAEDIFFLPSLVDRLILPPTDDEFKTYVGDFVQSAPVVEGIMSAGVPKAKSPGFLILCELLNRTGSPLLSVIERVLDEGLSRSKDVDRYTAALAVYGATPPTIKSAKAGANYPLKNLLLPLRMMDYIGVQEAFAYRHFQFVGLLELLCAASCREKLFSSALNVYRGSASFVPIVKFQDRPSAPDVWEVQAAQVGQVLNDGIHLQRIIELVGHDCIDVARTSSGFLFYLDRVQQKLPEPQPLFRAVASFVDHMSEQCMDDSASAKLLQALLDRVLVSLRAGRPPLLLSIPILNVVLETMITALNRHDFLRGAPRVAATCYEVLFRSMQHRSAVDVLAVCGFWTAHLNFVWNHISSESASPEARDFWYSIGWILAGLAEELNYLGSSVNVLMPSEETFVLRPQRYNEIVDLLETELLLESIIAAIPFSDPRISEFLSWAVHLLLGGIALSSRIFKNRFSLTGLVVILINNIGSSSSAPTTRNLSLALFTALDFQLAVDEKIPQDHIQVLANIVSRGGEGGIVSAAALASILRQSDLPQDELPQHALAGCVSVLLRVSCATYDTRSVPVKAKPEALLARICLRTILPNMEEALVQRLLTDHGDYGQASTALGAWIGLLAAFDGDIISLLKLLTGFSFGSDLLLDGDILRVLDMSGERVTNHMQALESNVLQPGRIGVPIHWQGHLELLAVITQRASQGRQIEAANQILRILTRYEPAAEKLLAGFPCDGDTALAYVNCCAVALEKAGSKQFSVPVASPEIPSLKSLSALAVHIIANPLPKIFRGNIPSSLVTQKIEDSLVTSVAEDETSWWDALGQVDWTKEHGFLFSSGMKATEIARTVFSVMRVADIIKKIDCRTIAKVLCRNVEAARVISFLENQHLQSQLYLDSMALEDLHRFKKGICESIHEILRAAITVLRLKYEIPPTTSYELANRNETVQPLKVALNFTQLDSVGPVFSDENVLGSINGVAKVLRELISA